MQWKIHTLSFFMEECKLAHWEYSVTPGGGALTYKNDGGAPTDASNQGAIGDNFLAKKGVIG